MMNEIESNMWFSLIAVNYEARDFGVKRGKNKSKIVEFEWICMM